MRAVRLPRFSDRSLRCPDAPVVASCLILLAVLLPAHAAVPPRFSTFLRENSAILSLGHDSSGNLYALGVLTNGPRFVARLDAAATKIAYFLKLSGLGCDQGSAMVVDGAGNIFITGSTSAASGQGYPCVLKLNTAGQVVYSFVLESAAAAVSQAIAIDSDGSAVVTGYATQLGFPSAGGAFSAPGSSLANFVVLQPFIARIDSTGSKLLSTAVGVGGTHIAIGPRGDVFVSGNAAGFGVANSAPNSYLVTPGAFQTTFTPSFDCTGFLCQMTVPSPEQYVTRLDSALIRLIYSTFVTGSNGANNQALAVDSAGTAYLTGTTRSGDYPYADGQTAGPRPGTFLTKLDPTGSKLVWSVQQGGNLLAFDSAGSLIVGGSALPAGGMPYQALLYPLQPPPPAGGLPAPCFPNGIRFQIAAFVQRLNPLDGSVLGTQFLSATQAQPAALDPLPDGRVLVAGYSVFPDIPITPGTVVSSAATQRTGYGAFLAAFDLATPSIGGPLACAADALTDMPLGPVAPGQLIALFGNGLGPAQPLSASISGPDPVVRSLGGVTVTFDGVAAPLVYVSDGQINLSVPWEVTLKTSTVMKVTVDGNLVASRQFAVAPASPSLFVDTSQPVSDGNGFFPAIALNSDGTKNSAANPAPGGSWVSIFLNGVAAYTGGTPPATGSITGPDPSPTSVVVRVAGLEAGPLIPWPGLISGLYQVQVKMPASTQAGVRLVLLTVALDGVPAAPLVYLNQVYQSAGMVWVN
jgi:uncharacterized protein (TIGR03437 family)